MNEKQRFQVHEEHTPVDNDGVYITYGVRSESRKMSMKEANTIVRELNCAPTEYIGHDTSDPSSNWVFFDVEMAAMNWALKDTVNRRVFRGKWVEQTEMELQVCTNQHGLGVLFRRKEEAVSNLRNTEIVVSVPNEEGRCNVEMWGSADGEETGSKFARLIWAAVHEINGAESATLRMLQSAFDAGYARGASEDDHSRKPWEPLAPSFDEWLGSKKP